MRRVAAVLVVVGLALPAGLARADDAPAPAPATSRPGALVVALGLQSPLLQAGVVRGRDVILARGFEVELARTLARRLGGRVSRFVYVPSRARLVVSGRVLEAECRAVLQAFFAERRRASARI